MSTIDVKPTPQPNPTAATKTVKVPVPEGDTNPEVKALEEDAVAKKGKPSEQRRGTFGGQQQPLKPLIGRGPRVRGADVHDVNVCDKAIDWYLIVEPMENSRFSEHAICRECHWGTYGLAPGDGVKELRKHVYNQHIFSA